MWSHTRYSDCGSTAGRNGESGWKNKSERHRHEQSQRAIDWQIEEYEAQNQEWVKGRAKRVAADGGTEIRAGKGHKSIIGMECKVVQKRGPGQTNSITVEWEGVAMHHAYEFLVKYWHARRIMREDTRTAEKGPRQGSLPQDPEEEEYELTRGRLW